MAANYRAVDHPHLGIVPMRDGSRDKIPNARATLTHEAIVTGGGGGVSLGQIMPAHQTSMSALPAKLRLGPLDQPAAESLSKTFVAVR